MLGILPGDGYFDEFVRRQGYEWIEEPYEETMPIDIGMEETVEVTAEAPKDEPPWILLGLLALVVFSD
jgi:hypothetical protein